jgi:hypothetical protein
VHLCGEGAGSVPVALYTERIYATFRLPCWQNASRSRLTRSACVQLGRAAARIVDFGGSLDQLG